MTEKKEEISTSSTCPVDEEQCAKTLDIPQTIDQSIINLFSGPRISRMLYLLSNGRSEDVVIKHNNVLFKYIIRKVLEAQPNSAQLLAQYESNKEIIKEELKSEDTQLLSETDYIIRRLPGQQMTQCKISKMFYGQEQEVDEDVLLVIPESVEETENVAKGNSLRSALESSAGQYLTWDKDNTNLLINAVYRHGNNAKVIEERCFPGVELERIRNKISNLITTQKIDESKIGTGEQIAAAGMSEKIVDYKELSGQYGKDFYLAWKASNSDIPLSQFFNIYKHFAFRFLTKQKLFIFEEQMDNIRIQIDQLREEQQLEFACLATQIMNEQ